MPLGVGDAGSIPAPANFFMKVRVKVMDKMLIVGLRSVSFEDDNGRMVEGTSFYYLMDADGVTGQMAGKFFLSLKKCDGMDYVPTVGDEVWVFYDRYGKPNRFEKVK